MLSRDLFIGTWVLDSGKNDYEFGNPPQQGKYIIEAKGDGYLVTMQWTDAEGNDAEMNYEATPDGKQYPSDAPHIDTQSMTRVDEQTLDSAAFIGENRIAYARRILSDDGNTMTITQSGKTPDGDDFANVSVYMREA